MTSTPTPTPALQDLPLDWLDVTKSLQSRAHTSGAAIEEYAQAMRDGDTFPPITVFNDDGVYWLSEGFHRVAAAHLAGLKTLPARVFIGTKLDALLRSVASNAQVPRTQEDKRRAVKLLLQNHPKAGELSNRRIARLCRVSAPFVGNIRREHPFLPQSPHEAHTPTPPSAPASPAPSPPALSPPTAPMPPTPRPEPVRHSHLGASSRTPQPAATSHLQLVQPAPEPEPTPPPAHLVPPGLSVNDCWRTPADVYDLLRREFGFHIDLAATPSSALCVEYLTIEQDALTIPWVTTQAAPGAGAGWLNPPYSQRNGGIGRWVEKAAEETRKGNLSTVVLLVPDNTSSAWFERACLLAHEVRFFRQRIAFVHPISGEAQSGNPWGSVLFIFRSGPRRDLRNGKRMLGREELCGMRFVDSTQREWIDTENDSEDDGRAA